MEVARKLAEYVVNTHYDDLPEETIDLAKKVMLCVIGTTVAGASEEGCETVANLVKEWGGKEEATILIHGGKVPAHNAAFVNSVMARALDYEDSIPPGAHLGASIVASALAAGEYAGGCSGKDFLVAVVVGLETSARVNSCSYYDGFDPTGIVSIFGSAAAAGRIMRLDPEPMVHALALAFNKSGGSFQCNIDGVLAVRVIQGFTSQGGIFCAQLAREGITGPPNFIEGMYGYTHLYGRDKYKTLDIIEGLGTNYKMKNILFKKYPSCGCTLTSTQATLELMGENKFSAEEINRVDIRLSPYCYALVGHPFKIGDNPRVNAQFSVQYCVANAILRKGSQLEHFEEHYIKDPKIMDFVKKIFVVSDPQLIVPGIESSPASEVTITTRGGAVYHKSVKIARGKPENPLTWGEHIEHFQDCMKYSRKPLAFEKSSRIISLIRQIEEVDDVNCLITLLNQERRYQH